MTGWFVHFFWGSEGNSKKIHFVNWNSILAFLNKGGLGIGSLKAFNCSLLSKWIWRSMHSVGSTWVNLLKSIHGENIGLDSHGCKTNGLWAAIVFNFRKCQELGVSLVRKVGNGCNTRFWKDLWLGPDTLASRFNRLYRLELSPDCTVNDRLSGPAWNWSRTPSGTCHFESLAAELQAVVLNNEEDRWVWVLHEDDCFSVKRTREFLDNLFLPSRDQPTWWLKNIPIKVNVFMWRLHLDRFPSRCNLSARGIDIESIICPIFLSRSETRDHTFLSCNVVNALWNRIRIWMDPQWPTFSTLDELFTWIYSRSIYSSSSVRILCIISATLWWIWRLRNDILFASNRIRKEELFDFIRLFSFLWVKSRSKFAPSWNFWLCNPL
ncbi:uncharacterized protein [Rutidosis leptorrhynchoides]|uniref:uncharacterized protein n=1 Tax=Rutidosis leptorrhynchoides TaxID=125765 RepID=UPI003A994453